MIKCKYRIVTDEFSGFEVQTRYLFFFYREVETNTHETIVEAMEYIAKKQFKSRVVKYVCR